MKDPVFCGFGVLFTGFFTAARFRMTGEMRVPVTPAGVIVHTGDFKVDFTPIEGGIIDLARFGELGNRGVLALMADSTNAERPGHTATERTVGNSFEKLFDKAEGKRIIIATTCWTPASLRIMNCKR